MHVRDIQVDRVGITFVRFVDLGGGRGGNRQQGRDGDKTVDHGGRSAKLINKRGVAAIAVQRYAAIIRKWTCREAIRHVT